MLKPSIFFPCWLSIHSQMRLQREDHWLNVDWLKLSQPNQRVIFSTNQSMVDRVSLISWTYDESNHHLQEPWNLPYQHWLISSSHIHLSVRRWIHQQDHLIIRLHILSSIILQLLGISLIISYLLQQYNRLSLILV